MSRRTKQMLLMCRQEKIKEQEKYDSVSQTEQAINMKEKKYNVEDWLSNIDVQYVGPSDDSLETSKYESTKINILSDILLPQNTNTIKQTNYPKCTQISQNNTNTIKQTNYPKCTQVSQNKENVIDEDLVKLHSFKDNVFLINKTKNEYRKDNFIEDPFYFSPKNEYPKDFETVDFYKSNDDMVRNIQTQPTLTLLSNYPIDEQYYLNENTNDDKNKNIQIQPTLTVLSNCPIDEQYYSNKDLNLRKRKMFSSNFETVDFQNLNDVMKKNIQIQPTLTVLSNCTMDKEYYSNETTATQVGTKAKEKENDSNINRNFCNTILKSSLKYTNDVKPDNETIFTKEKQEMINFNDTASPSKTSTIISPSFTDDSFEDPQYFPSESDYSEDSSLTEEKKYVTEEKKYVTEEKKCVTEEFNSNVKKSYILPEIVSKPKSSLDCKSTLQMSLDKVTTETVETVKKSNYKDKLNYCFYCDKDVTHFVRHILTWHLSEITVQKIMSFPKNSKARRGVISTLRKKGNFVKNRADDTLRPVKRLKSNDSCQTHEFLPCSYCLGYYKKKSLYRHTKKCPENTEICNRRQTAQSDGQTTLLMGELLKYDQLLTKELFPRMRADNINLIAKKDALICQYAYSYMKGRKSKGNLDFVRQNMRRLAKFLEFVRKKEPSLKNLIDILRPTHFSLILAGVNHLARYNPETEVYESPTLAMNFGTLLKKCCDLAYIHLIQIENTDDKRKDIKILKKLIESQWADEISAQAGLNLNEKKWNKNELLPLTSDLKKLSIFSQKVAEDAFKELQKNEKNYTAYNTLKDIVYTQIILLNRRRPAEVAQLKIENYNIINNINDDNRNTEFEKCLTETEKILLNSYSRIVLRGKRGRGVPILLSPVMKKHFDYFISIRDKFIKDNRYVFHTSGRGFLDGTKTLYKFAEKCGVDKPKSISATKLRKHLATITQLLQFSEKDLEQLSQFMGHTLKTHLKVYRLSDSMYQTAKISKLLLLMTQGGIEQYVGKKLDDIDVELSPVIEEENILNKINCNEEDDEEKQQSSAQLERVMKSRRPIEEDDEKKQQSSAQLEPVMKARRPITRHNWTVIEKKMIADFFSDHIKQKRAPKQKEVEALITMYPEVFKNKKWTSIKAVVFNIYTGKLNANLVF